LGTPLVELGPTGKKVFKVELVISSFLLRMDRATSFPRKDKRDVAGLAGTPFPRSRNKNGRRRCKLSTRNSG
jgi:hypothetical protein